MDWVPREQNQEADSNTNGNVQWLNPLKEAHARKNKHIKQIDTKRYVVRALVSPVTAHKRRVVRPLVDH